MGFISLKEMEDYISKKGEVLTPKEEEFKLEETPKVFLSSLNETKLTKKSFEKQINKIKDSINDMILSVNDSNKEKIIFYLNQIIFNTSFLLNALKIDTNQAWKDFLNNKENDKNIGKLKDLFGDK